MMVPAVSGLGWILVLGFSRTGLGLLLAMISLTDSCLRPKILLISSCFMFIYTNLNALPSDSSEGRKHESVHEVPKQFRLPDL